MKKINSLNIIQPDDWHVHLREGDMLNAVIKSSSRINHRCIVMPNLKKPVTTSKMGIEYKKKIFNLVSESSFLPLLPCYLTDNLDLVDFKNGLESNIFVGAKLYPENATTNSDFGISKIEKIFSALEILSELSKPLLVHGEKISDDIDIFDREKAFIDSDLFEIREKFPNLKIVLEHVSSKYGADFVNQNNNISATITPQHMLLTKKDVFFNNTLNPYHLCMPVVKEETDLIALRKYACSGNSKFFLGTDSAPHHVNKKKLNFESSPGIFSAPCSIELYASIFDEEDSMDKLEGFASINGPKFYNYPININKVILERSEWFVPEFTIYNDMKVKNFMAGKKINWKVIK